MRIAVLGASGRVGGLLVEQAIERGHDVVALVRAPDTFKASNPRPIDVRQADVRSPRTFPALDDVDAAVSAIGLAKGEGPGALTAGARLLAAVRVRTVWLGALGSGASTGAGGRIYQAVMRMAVGAELAEKAEADRIALDAGASVFHAPDLTNGPVSPQRRTVPLAELRRPLLPPRMSRASVAALMLDEAEAGSHAGAIVVPLG
ncbi:NAD(P)-dependent oxidoreductase [Streptomyces montanisoli]|uniref:NAD(P)H-binding protein n=1 Tax=Streptomyces montanisoli TaxID=2798581 RepID=A0A940RXP3_9ACTN|nr:NAD(P)H-binding protein [Streptomyces montanisoli]MBP0461437.1 NAD(P)H-binding protein [Streptomyces montanisoli]